jgi:hypothetical protein
VPTLLMLMQKPLTKLMQLMVLVLPMQLLPQEFPQQVRPDKGRR